jgi:hypothetical protein
MHKGFWFERHHFLDQGTDGRILSKNETGLEVMDWMHLAGALD